MSTDPTALDVKVPDTGFMDDYDTGGGFTPPPQPKEATPSGRAKYIQFLVQAPGVSGIQLKDANDQWLKTREGYLKAVIDGITLVEGGYKVGQTHVGTAQYKKYDKKTNQPIPGEFRNASPAQDYFRAHGIDARPGTPEEYQSLFEATADRQFQITGDWSAYDSEAKTDVASKWEDFPDATTDPEAFARMYPGQDPAGKKLPFVERNGKRYWARLNVKRYISQVADKK